MDHIMWMRVKLVTCYLVLLFGNRLTIAAGPAYSAVYAFGDSILDTGNNNFLSTVLKSNSLPYGKDYYGGEASGRFADGRVLSDLIISALGIKVTCPAYLGGRIKNEYEQYPTGVSFASGGSGNDDLTANMQGGVLTMSEQLNYFVEYIGKLKQMVGEVNASSIISNALVVISSGNNDIAITHSLPSRAVIPFNTYAANLVTVTQNFLKNLYNLGVRHVWTLSTLPLGCLPGARSALGGPLRLCVDNVNGEAQVFNGLLQAGVTSLRNSLPGFDAKFIDVYTPMLNIINNPFPSGFTNVVNGCCGTWTVENGPTCNSNSFVCPVPSSYFFWDYAGHPTTRAYKLTLAAILRTQNINATTPTN